MRYLLAIITIFLFVVTPSKSQVNSTGAPIIKWFDAMDTPGDLQNWSITMDGRGVMYFGNQTKGIVTYDGQQWGLIQMPTQQRVNALATDYRGVVFVGGETDFGYLEPDISGEIRYVSLSLRLTDSLSTSELRMIYSITADSSTVYFTDRRKIYQYNFLKDNISVIDLNRQYNLRNSGRLLNKGGRIILADNREGLFELSEGKIIPLPGGDMLKMVLFMSMTDYDRDNILIATYDHGLYLFNLTTGQLNENFLADELNKKLSREMISGITRLPGNGFAIGVTSGEGVYLLDHNGILQQQISTETTSVQESTVTALYCDFNTNSQLWFCTMGYINRAYVSLPAYEFGSGAGIRTTLGDIREYGGSVFVSCDNGLYKSYVDNSGRMRFERYEGVVNQSFELLVTSSGDNDVLMAATVKGISVLDIEGDVTEILDNAHIVTLKPDADEKGSVLAGSMDGIIYKLRNEDDTWKIAGRTARKDIPGLIMATEQSAGDWWIVTASPYSLYRMKTDGNDTLLVKYGRDKGIVSDTINYVVQIDTVLYVCTGRGIYSYDSQSDNFHSDSDIAGDNFSNTDIFRIFRTPEGEIFVSGYDTRNFDALVTPTSQGFVVFRRQFDFLPDIATADIEYINGNIWLVKGRSIYVIDKSKLGYSYGSFSTIFTSVIAGVDNVLMRGTFYHSDAHGVRIPSVLQDKDNTPVVRYSENDISFHWTTTSYVGEEKTSYRYRLEGFDHDWSKWDYRTTKDFTNLPYGDYVFRLKAKTLTGLEGDEVSFSFSIAKPWYFTAAAIILYTLAALVIIFLIILFYTRKLKNENVRLENLVLHRTAEVVRQKEELEASIHYASRIQRALLPGEKILSDKTTGSFILFRPRDIVSGDFYWMTRIGEKLFVVAADCTGHGVPGAFMSLLGISFLDEIVNKMGVVTANSVLGELRRQVIASLKQIGETDEQKDGMDLGLLVFDYKERKVEFAGAYNPCFMVRPMNEDEISKWKNGDLDLDEGELANGRYILLTVNPDKMPIGISSRMNVEFKVQEWEMDKDVSYYLFTDGYIDQFNGVTGKKFMKKNFKKLLLDVQDFPMSRQKEMLEERLSSWMGASPQVDDILVLGIKP